jgi:predicted DNA-binding protein (MmcQ/YjbR family)
MEGARLAPRSPLEARLREAALAFPEATLDYPWGECAFKVRRKVFLFLRGDEAHVSLSLKLPRSCAAALELEHTEPTGYGLGRSGWVTARLPLPVPERAGPGVVSLALLLAWLDESYRAVAPRTLSKALASPGARATKQASAPAKKAPAKKAPAKKAPAKKAPARP